MKKFWFYTFFLLTLLSCKQPSATAVPAESKKVDIPTFNSDSAYKFVKTQVDFGPRVPNSTAHKKCGNYLSQALKSYGAVVYEQNMTLTAFDGNTLKSVNIIGAFNPDAQKRITLFSHWDCRPFSDQDADPANHKKPVDGANDGASGVGVLLEIARQLGQKMPGVGVDIVFFDAEDYGATEGSANNSDKEKKKLKRLN